VSGWEYLNVFPLYDWRHVPGTTVELFPGSDHLSCAGQTAPKYRGSSHFVGGVDADGGKGVFAFAMSPVAAGHENTTLRAHKSWFWLGDGSVISCVDEISAEHAVVTTLEQAWADAPKANGAAIKRGETKTGTAFGNGGFVYRSLSDGAELTASVEHKAAGWTVVADEYGDYPSVEGEVFALTFAHGEKPAPLCHSVTVGGGAPSRATIERTASVTSVSRPGANATVGAVFWEAGSANLSQTEQLRASAPCTVVATAVSGGGWELHAADPSRELAALTLTVDSGAGTAPCAWEVPLPQGTAAGSSVAGKLSCG